MRSGGFFDYDAKRERLEEVERELESPDVWNDPERAQALGRERASLDKNVNGIRILVLIVRLDGRTPVTDWIPFTRCLLPGRQLVVHSL